MRGSIRRRGKKSWLLTLEFGYVRDRETGKAVGDVDLDVEHASLETQGGGGVDTGEHSASSARESILSISIHSRLRARWS